MIRCRRCPRLVAWREQVARERRAAFADEEYWGRPCRGSATRGASVLLLGLAPAAHGGNRTGRVFTGDRSGDFLFAGLWRTGLRTSPTRSLATTACDCAAHGSPRPCAARHPRTAPRARSATTACRGRERARAARRTCGSRVPRRVRVGRALRLPRRAARKRAQAAICVTAPSNPARRSRCSAAFTRASRTRSRAASRSRCSTQCSCARAGSPDSPAAPRGAASLAWMRPVRVGHKGAADIAPGNTLESFDAALAAGVDMIEFDVLSEHRDRTGRLLLAHDYDDLPIAQRGHARGWARASGECPLCRGRARRRRQASRDTGAASWTRCAPMACSSARS